MAGSAKRALENIKALEPTQQERVNQALVQAQEMRALARAQVILMRAEATLAGKGSAGRQSEGP